MPPALFPQLNESKWLLEFVYSHAILSFGPNLKTIKKSLYAGIHLIVTLGLRIFIDKSYSRDI